MPEMIYMSLATLSYKDITASAWPLSLCLPLSLPFSLSLPLLISISNSLSLSDYDSKKKPAAMLKAILWRGSCGEKIKKTLANKHVSVPS